VTVAKKIRADEDGLTELLEKILIVQLALGGVPQQSIRRIVGCDINRVSAIAKHISRTRGQPGRDQSEERPDV
jgi:hypothetical protein